MANNFEDENDIIAKNIWSMSTSGTSVNLSGVRSSAVISFGDYYGPEESSTKTCCRKCGKYCEAQINFIGRFCAKCTRTIIDEVFKSTMPKTSEYCQDCFSHFKACTCEKKQAMDNLKS